MPAGRSKLDVTKIMLDISAKVKELCGNGDVTLSYTEYSGWMIMAGNNTPVPLGEYGGEVSSWWRKDFPACVEEIEEEIKNYGS